MTFTPGSDEGRTDTFEAQTAEPDRDIDKRAKEEFEEAQSGIKFAGDTLYNFAKGVLFITTGGSVQATQALDALRAKIEGKPFVPPSPNPNAPGIVNLEPITTEDAFTRPDMTGTGQQPEIEDVPQYPVVVQRILKGKKDNPEFFSNIVNSIGKDNNRDTNRPFTTPEEDEELTRKYKEITNPDNRITDREDPDYGRLKSEVFAEREEISRRQEIERQRNLIIEAKGDNLLGMLSDEELQKVFPKSYRSFYNKLKPDKKGRFVDLRRRFDIKKIREMYPGDENEDFRRTVFALAADPRFSSTTFTKTRKNLIGEWLEGLDDIQERVIAETNNTKTLEAHHINSIRHVASLFDGFDFNERIILRNRLLENMFPVGNNPDNLILLNDKIHDEIHRQLDTQVGKFAGKFIEEGKRYTLEEALDVAKRMGTVVNQITQEAYDSMAEYMAQKFEEESPSAKMAAEMSMNEVKPILEAVLDEYVDFANKKAEESMRRAMENLPQTQEGVLPVDIEDQPAAKPTRLTRGKGKKTIERQRMLEEKYGKQLEL